MNVEFIIHGVLSSGQTISVQNDSDYYKQFYSEQKTDTMMTVEIVERPHGISTYYNYLRNNNIVSAREGSYFGMTVRIDEAFCSDIKSMYFMLNNLFEKMIVGNILKQINDRFEYVVDSFSIDYISRVETQFTSMINSIFSSSDFVNISRLNISVGKVYSVNPYDLSLAIVSDIFRNNIKLYVSPSYSLAQLKSFQATIDKVKSEADARIQDTLDAKNESERKIQEQYKGSADKIKILEKQVEELIDANARLIQENRKHRKDSEIISAVEGIKKPIEELASLFGSRFQEGNNVLNKSSNKDVQIIPKAKCGGNSSSFGLQMVNFILGVLILVVLLWSSVTNNKHDNIDIIKSVQERIDSLVTKISDMSNPKVITSESIGADASSDNDVGAIDYSNLRINIKGLSNGQTKLQPNKSYTFEIRGGDFPNDGSWSITIDSIEISTYNTIYIQPSDTLKILTASYLVNNKPIVTRTISIK